MGLQCLVPLALLFNLRYVFLNTFLQRVFILENEQTGTLMVHCPIRARPIQAGYIRSPKGRGRLKAFGDISDTELGIFPLEKPS